MKNKKNQIKTLKFKEMFKNMVKNEIKTSTIRKHNNLKEKDVFCVYGIQNTYFQILKINRIRFDEINKEMALKEGYLHEDLLIRDLTDIYGDIEDSDLFYQIEFKKIKHTDPLFKEIREDAVKKFKNE